MNKMVNRNMSDCCLGYIVIFDDGTYFNGVKGKRVRKTKRFKDAKLFGSLSERDEGYLKKYNYKIVHATFYMAIDY